ncbi:MAG: tRNA dihydrouridine synthase DusB [Neisseriaceae bacterium]|nr:tRNA dihydrouridine synthase DusB [Neisseriaceae bacterium]
MKIAHFQLSSPTALAPMAGLSDNPMRRLCRQFGAGLTVGEMISGAPALRHTRKTRNRIDFSGETSPIVVQIVGVEPEQMAQSAVYYQGLGVDIIDINMGCPAKKVCKREAGSALMQNEALVAEILATVVQSVAIPVTLKTRLGWDDLHLNVLKIAEIAEKSGISAIAIHGRSRTQMFQGHAQYDLIGKVKKAISLPVWVNGDIDSPQKAAQVLEETQADGVMIGRAAIGCPWIFAEINQYFSGSTKEIDFATKTAAILQHLRLLYDFYGENHGVKIARKHIARYIADLPNSEIFRQNINKINELSIQYECVSEFLSQCQKMTTHA